MVIRIADEQTEAGEQPPVGASERMERYSEDRGEAGVLVAVSFTGGQADEPTAEAKGDDRQFDNLTVVERREVEVAVGQGAVDAEPAALGVGGEAGPEVDVMLAIRVVARLGGAGAAQLTGNVHTFAKPGIGVPSAANGPPPSFFSRPRCGGSGWVAADANGVNDGGTPAPGAAGVEPHHPSPTPSRVFLVTVWVGFVRRSGRGRGRR